MEPHENRQLALQRAISTHEQAAAALADLMEGGAGEPFAAMLARLEQNVAELQRLAAGSRPGEHV